jgi:hypothetical protein
MLGKTIRELEELKVQLEAELLDVHYACTWPHSTEIQKSHIMLRIENVEAEIQHQKDMLPFKLTLCGFVVALLGLIIYSI